MVSRRSLFNRHGLVTDPGQRSLLNRNGLVADQSLTAMALTATASRGSLF